MNITKWINDHATDGKYVLEPDSILIEDLKKLLKTHTLVPNEPTEAMIDEAINQGGCPSAARHQYNAMLEASKEEE